MQGPCTNRPSQTWQAWPSQWGLQRARRRPSRRTGPEARLLQDPIAGIGGSKLSSCHGPLAAVDVFVDSWRHFWEALFFLNLATITSRNQCSARKCINLTAGHFVKAVCRAQEASTPYISTEHKLDVVRIQSFDFRKFECKSCEDKSQFNNLLIRKRDDNW